MSESPTWVVHKFGGTSVANAERYRRVETILTDRQEPHQAVVVSAMSGMTDALVELVELAGARDITYKEKLGAVRTKQLQAVEDLLTGDAQTQLTTTFEQDFDDLADLLHATWLLRSWSRTTMELVTGYGELWSAQVLCAYAKQCGHEVAWIDARDIITVTPTDNTPKLLLELSRQKMQGWLAEHDQYKLLIITGFIASTEEGIPTTLGRNGSDYSAAIISNLVDAPNLYIWTDVDGVLSANPRQVPDAVVLNDLSYKEAMELAYFGAKVLHPSTIAPAISKQVVITIKNTFNPDAPGTKIHAVGSSDFAVKGFATIEDIALINLEGTTLIGVPGIAERLFGALRQSGVSVIMISQGSSEHSICFAIPSRQIEAAQKAVDSAFFAERHQGQIQTLDINDQCSILAVVGDNMEGQTGIAGKFFQALGAANINIRAIAQGSSERNISVVIDKKDTTRALRAVHAGFYLSHQTLSIGLVGPGIVGSVLLSQLHQQSQWLKDEFNVDLRVRAIADSQHMILDEQGIDLANWRVQMAENGQPLDMNALIDHVQTDHLPHAACIDCTASEHVATRYDQWLARGVHVVTPNKKANTRTYAEYQALQAHRKHHRHYLYETTVGAGLPIIQTVRDLIQTGDRVLSIEGILSGTLSYLFNAYDGTVPFSTLLAQAKAQGFTEPDPREDLSGMDVARKAVILAREIGLNLELDDIQLEGLVPPSLVDCDVETFMNRIHEHDDQMQQLFEQAASDQQVLRFVARIEDGGQATVSLQRLPNDHPFASIQLTDNVVLFRTTRYSDNPLVIQGPGAGPAVTAGGIFGDLLRLVSYLGVSR